MESLSKTPWYGIPIFYAPLVLYFMNIAETDVKTTAMLTFFGIICWTLIEYVLHRFLFHSELYVTFPNKVAICGHFMFHGIHHSFPMDRYRLVFPPLPGFMIFYYMIRPVYEAIFP